MSCDGLSISGAHTDRSAPPADLTRINRLTSLDRTHSESLIDTITIQFLNHRAHWKTKQIKCDFIVLCIRHDALRLECDSLCSDKDAPAAELYHGVERESGQADDGEARGHGGATHVGIGVDGRQVDGQRVEAVFTEKASPYSGAVFNHHHHSQTLPSYGMTWFTSL
ncbi:hypothetical protein E2562_023244 [Oryza meyeriana var. granulata]|uniref:Uncharacterized protein n=1 Tax=Oryza meyeriana var. granulata TaxID=110450 RepID=A0A6G1DLY3_9ORYZ|nr:hypothetical protein E2562_023244 [Oryza meyeriana var. granulata]